MLTSWADFNLTWAFPDDNAQGLVPRAVRPNQWQIKEKDMKNLSKIALVVVVSIALLSTVAVLTPRVVHAVTAQLVQNVDSPPRNPWAGTCTASGSTTSDYFTCVIPALPGYEIAVQTVTIAGFTSDNHTHVILSLKTFGGGYSEVWNNQIDATISASVLLQVPGYTGIHQNSYFSTQPAIQYVDPTFTNLDASVVPNEIAVTVETDSGNPHGLGGTVSLTGYSVNLGAADN
jgi:hypothetical protein